MLVGVVVGVRLCGLAVVGVRMVARMFVLGVGSCLAQRSLGVCPTALLVVADVGDLVVLWAGW